MALDNQAYQGAQDANSGSGEFNAASFLVRQILAQIGTSMPCTVVAVGTGTVDVQPMVNQIDGYGNATEHGTIHNLPFIRIQGGGNALIIDPQVGDIGDVFFASRDISSVKANKAVSNPGSRRQHDMADGVYLGGLLNGAPNNFIQIANGQITLNGLVQINLTAPETIVSGNLTVTNGFTGTIPASDGSIVTFIGGIAYNANNSG